VETVNLMDNLPTDAMNDYIDIGEQKTDCGLVVRQVLDTLHSPAILMDVLGRIIHVNGACEKLSGLADDDLKGRAVFDTLIQDRGFAEVLDELHQGAHCVRHENITSSWKDISVVWLATSLVGDADFRAYVITGRDDTQTQLAEMRHEYGSNFDGVTELPNRAFFFDHLGYTLGQARRSGRVFALIYVNIDDFKIINETLSHDIGDLLLKMVAKRFMALKRRSDVLTSLGGDEFVLILNGFEQKEDAAMSAERLLNSFSEPFYLDGHECFVSASIGISIYPDDGEDIDSLIKNADIAMNQAKAKGKNTFRFFSIETSSGALKRLELKTNLRRAVERDEFMVYYQPRVDLKKNAIGGMEALVRWNSPTFGLVSPVDFIPLAEETGLIVPIGGIVLSRACIFTKSLIDAGQELKVSVNLSGRQFKSPNLIETIARTLKDTGLDPKYLELELTESIIMQDDRSTIRLLGTLKDMGLHISIDDFGTGYSSLSYLKRFPIDALKIDRSFITEIMIDDDDRSIVTAIISMAHGLGLKVVAEGVEDQDQADFLLFLGCDEIQGYLFGKPMPEEVFKAAAAQLTSLMI
jgi:diguanylate cyclase (GGDEF)-like protein/PAS domain S-box-containing protein